MFKIPQKGHLPTSVPADYLAFYLGLIRIDDDFTSLYATYITTNLAHVKTPL